MNDFGWGLGVAWGAELDQEVHWLNLVSAAPSIAHKILIEVKGRRLRKVLTRNHVAWLFLFPVFQFGDVVHDLVSDCLRTFSFQLPLLLPLDRRVPVVFDCVVSSPGQQLGDDGPSVAQDAVGL